jgi:hypothetical protein
MSSEITCPVCKFEHIPHDRDTCPQCDSDLICFRLLETLSDRPGASVPDAEIDAEIDRADQTDLIGQTHKSKIPWLQVFLSVIILLIIVCLGGYSAHRFSVMESMVGKIEIDMAQVTHLVNKNPNKIIKSIEAGTNQIKYLEKSVKEIAQLTKDNEIGLARIVLKKEKNSKIPAREIKTFKNQDKFENQDRIEKTCFKIYQAKDEDTLWDIARDLYGSGIFYPLLMEHNPDLSVYSIGSKNTLRYLCDKTLAAGVLKAITGMKQNRRYWKYRIRSKDTREAIIKRYCLNQKDCLVKDKDKPLKPGMTIGVFLE